MLDFVQNKVCFFDKAEKLYNTIRFYTNFFVNTTFGSEIKFVLTKFCV